MGFFKTKTCLILTITISVILIFSCVGVFLIFRGLFTIQAPTIDYGENSDNNDQAISNDTNSQNTKCSINYDSNSYNWTYYTSTQAPKFSIKIPETFTTKELEAGRYQIIGSEEKGCEHFVIISGMDYPYPAVDCKTNYESAKSTKVEGSEISNYRSEKINGIDTCIFDTTVKDSTGTTYRRSYMFYTNNKYFFISPSAFDKRTIEFYDSIVKTIKFS